MRFKNSLLFFFVLLCACDFSYAQQTPAQKDSIQLYENIQSYSRRNKLTKFIYRLIFRPVATESPKVVQATKPLRRNKSKKPVPKSNVNYEGKIIRHIIIEVLDPFGRQVGDSIVAPQNFILRAGNKTHIKSQRNTIRNLLLIHKNQKFDSLLVKESERLIRSQSFVKDIAFITVPTSKNSDSVDVFIRELDKWSIGVKIGASPARAIINVTDKNFFGLGHESINNYTWHHTNGEHAFYSNYFIPNIRNTYISTNLHYGTDEFRNSVRSISFDRPFFSAYAKWAFGATLTQELNRDSIMINETTYAPQRFKLNNQDYWLGNSTQIFRGKTENNRTTNFISAIRFIRNTYSEKPPTQFDTLGIYTPSNFYLGTIGISTRKYVQDNYIFKYGVTEDIPIGKAYSLTGGYLEKNKTGHLYMGVRIAIGNFYSWGYLSSSFEYATYFHALNPEEGTFSTTLIYFTKLFEIGKWKFRQFVKPQATFGLKRLTGEGITLNDGYGIDGFSSSELKGVNRLFLKLQTQSYAPWKIISFRFGPYLVYSMGMLSDDETGFSRSRVYSQFGLGLLFKNDNLVFSSFQFSLSFYPSIPGYKQNVFKINSVKTNDFGFRDFDVGKPSTIGYQ